MLNTLLSAFAVVGGAFGALFPERVIDPVTRAALAGYENPEDLEASEWYVTAIRTKFALISLAGVVALVVERVGTSGVKEAAEKADDD